jgi:hypothetical protein
MDLESFRRTLRYQRAAAPDEIADDLDELARFDAIQEQGQRRWRRLMVTGIVGLFVSPCVGGALSEGTSVPGLGFVLAGAFLIFAVVAGLLMRRWGRFNLPNERYQALRALCRLVKADLPDQAPVDVDLDLARPSRLVRELERGVWKCKVYVQPWLRLRGRLVDGTRFEVRAVERQEVRTCWKQTSRGKQKHKRKVKSTALLDVTLAAKSARAGDLSAHGALLTRAVQLPEQSQLVRAQATAEELALRARVPGSDPARIERTVAMMMLSLYQVLGFAQQQRKETA